MWKPRWWLAFPLALTVMLSLGTSQAGAGTVHDNAGMFSKEAVAKANAELSRIERDLQLNATIETIPSLDGEDIRDVAPRQAERFGESGLFVLIAKKETKFRVLVSNAYKRTLLSREPAMRTAFTSEFQKKDFDAGLLKGVQAIGSEAASARAEFGSLKQAGGAGAGRVNHNNAAPFRGLPARRGGGFGISSLLWIGLLIFGGLFVIRMLGSLFGGRGQHGYGQQGRMGGPGYGGPGYGGGGGGGGFMSGLLGGLGGAVAGNWLYDQFSGRHHGGNYADTTGSDAGNAPDAPAAEGWSADAGSTGDWGGGGGDAGGGGGGGDWGGGGGGDWGGGGGGDWGGGGGGGGGDW
jgi:uncharacterized membrane protein YgcG